MSYEKGSEPQARGVSWLLSGTAIGSRICLAPENGAGGGAAVSAPEGNLSVGDAVTHLANVRHEGHVPPEEEDTDGEAPDYGDPDEESASEDVDGDPDEDQHTAEDDEDVGSDDPEDDLPTIDPPKSWTKEEKEAFRLLPPEHQKRISERERTRELEIRRGQNEIAERLKALEPKAAELEEARQRYELALPTLYEQYAQGFHDRFSDIKTWADVEKLQQTDFVRYQEYQLMREKGEALRVEAEAAQNRQHEQWQANFSTYVESEHKRFFELAPEFADPEKAPQLQAQARALLTDVGYSEGEIRAALQGQSSISPHDHRFQMILRDAMKYRAAKTVTKKAPTKATPPVQRPGHAKTKGEVRTGRIQDLETRLNKSGSAKDAAALLSAMRTTRAS